MAGTERREKDRPVLDRETRFAYLGPEGTFTEQALRRLPEAVGARLLPADSAEQALHRVRSGAADAAMLPVHNTVAGLVPDTVRALVAAPAVTVLREVALAVEFALLVRPGTRIEQIRTVTGHPHAHRQVRRWLHTWLPGADWQPAPSNAAGARRVRDGECDAAIAGEFAAARYGLRVAATRAQDAPGDAVTRFLLCTHVPGGGGRSARAHRTSLIGRLQGRPEQIGPLIDEVGRHPAARGVALHLTPYDATSTALFADCPGPADEPVTARAVGFLRWRLPGLRSLGSYAVHGSPLARERNDDMPHPNDIESLRRRIDVLDASLIDTLRRRLEVSRKVQGIRTGGGGPRVDAGRELNVRGRYAEAFGPAGTEIADLMLQMCRGRSER